MGNYFSKCFSTSNNEKKEKDINDNTTTKKEIIKSDKINTDLSNNAKDHNKTSEFNLKESAGKKHGNVSEIKSLNKKENVLIDQKEVLSGTIKTNKDDYFDSNELSYYFDLYKSEQFEVSGQKITRYQKGELLGEGSFGKVYKVFEEEGGQIFAMKEIDLKNITAKHLERIKSFEKEIELLSKLKHKNIIKYFGTSRDNQILAIFLDYCIGGSIAKMIDDFGKFPESLIRKYTKQILEGLEYLHSHDVIHRDIKGANILVDKEGVCKLTDFGGSKQLVEDIEVEKQKSFKGTPHWMAPETIKTLESTRYSDIWSLGCTVIEMATGEPPWSQYTNQITALYNIMNAQKPPDLPDFLSDDLKDFLNKCMKINPKERLNVYKLLRHPFITGEMTMKREYKRVNSDKNLQTLNRRRKDTSDNVFKNQEVQVNNITPIFQD